MFLTAPAQLQERTKEKKHHFPKKPFKPYPAYPNTYHHPTCNNNEMTPTTQLRILRTPLHFRSITLPIRPTRVGFNASRRHVQPSCLLVRRQLRSFTTTTSLSTSKEQPSSPVHNDGATEKPTTTHPAPTLYPTAANPPATTRPPPLVLPTRGPDTSTLPHIIATGRAYLTFYKTGLKYIYLNTRLVWSLKSPTRNTPTDNPITIPLPLQSQVPPGKSATTRARELLRRRWGHDVRRLPLFALMLVICGEFTPLVVLTLPSLVPYTCRIPRQVEKLRAKTEERRRRSTARLLEMIRQRQSLKQGEGSGSSSSEPIATAATTSTTATTPTTTRMMILELSHNEVMAHIARSLNLISPLWDRLPLSDAAVALLSRRRVQRHLTFLERDGTLLRQAGGVDALEEEEVPLACTDRGMNILDGTAKTEPETELLRRRLREWLDREESWTHGDAVAAGWAKTAILLLSEDFSNAHP